MDMEEDTLELIRQHPDKPLVIENGEVVDKDILEAYNKFIERGLAPEFCTLDKEGNIVPLLDQPLSKDDFK